MTTKVLGMLEQVSALKDYLEEHAEELSDGQANSLQMSIDTAWGIADRRRKGDRRG